MKLMSALVACMTFGGAAYAAEPVVIGEIYPSKTVVGQEALHGGEIAAQLINAAGGVLGRPLKLISYDTNFAPAEGVSAVQRLIDQDGVKVVVGEVSSTVALAVAPVIEGEDAVFIAAVPKHPDVTKAGQKAVFRANSTTAMDDGAFNDILTRQVAPQRVALIGENSDFGQLEIANWKKLFGDKVVSSTLFGMQQSDFSALVTNLHASNADLVCIVSTNVEQYGNILAMLRQVGYQPKICLAPGTLTADGIRVAGPAIENAISTDIYLPSAPGAANTQFVDAFRAKFHQEPGKIEELGFEVVFIAAKAIQQAGTTDDADRIATAIHAGQWETPRGKVTFDAVGQAHGAAAIPVTVREGKIIAAQP